MQITTGINERAQKIVIYGPEGIGKSTIASQFPKALFSDVEGSTDRLNVARAPKPQSWEMLKQQAQYLKRHPETCETWIIDTADWAEKLCVNHICSEHNKKGIEDIGYGKGYVYLEEEFGRFLNLCSELLDVGINVVFTAHAQMRKFEQPDETGAYDRWELKLTKKTSPLLKEWADCILFANYKTYVVNVDNQGAAKGKNKAQGGQRVMKTTHHPCWDAKNRYGLEDEVPFEFKQIAHCIPTRQAQATATPPVAEQPKAEIQPQPQPETKPQTPPPEKKQEEPQKTEPPQDDDDIVIDFTKIPPALAQLMLENRVTVEEIQKAVAHKGYYPQSTPIENYDPSFVSGVLIAAWQQVFKLIKDEIRPLPF
jgi:hypothetical protein